MQLNVYIHFISTYMYVVHRYYAGHAIIVYRLYCYLSLYIASCFRNSYLKSLWYCNCFSQCVPFSSERHSSSYNSPHICLPTWFADVQPKYQTDKTVLIKLTTEKDYQLQNLNKRYVMWDFLQRRRWGNPYQRQEQNWLDKDCQLLKLCKTKRIKCFVMARSFHQLII